MQVEPFKERKSSQSEQAHLAIALHNIPECRDTADIHQLGSHPLGPHDPKIIIWRNSLRIETPRIEVVNIMQEERKQHAYISPDQHSSVQNCAEKTCTAEPCYHETWCGLQKKILLAWQDPRYLLRPVDRSRPNTKSKTNRRGLKKRTQWDGDYPHQQLGQVSSY